MYVSPVLRFESENAFGGDLIQLGASSNLTDTFFDVSNTTNMIYSSQ